MILSVSFSTAFKTIGNLCSDEASNNITMDNCSSPMNNCSSPQTEKKIIRNEVFYSRLFITDKGYIGSVKFVVNLACYYGPYILVPVHPVRGEGMGWIGGIVIIASCGYHSIRVHENLVKYPNNNTYRYWFFSYKLCDHFKTLF